MIAPEPLNGDGLSDDYDAYPEALDGYLSEVADGEKPG
jgi:hypothetical protein